MAKESTAAAAAVLDKEQTRQIVVQAAGFLKIFGGAYYRIRVIAALLDVQTQPAVWDVIWTAFADDPSLKKAMSEMSAAATVNETSPEDAVASIRKVYEAAGEAPPDGFDKLCEIVEGKGVASSAEKERFRRGISAALATLQMWSFFLGSRQLKEYTAFVVNLFMNHFDEVWAIEHPEDE